MISCFAIWSGFTCGYLPRSVHEISHILQGTLTTRSCSSGRVVPEGICRLAYTGQVTFYKVPQQHGHVHLVGLYLRVFARLYELVSGPREDLEELRLELRR